MTNPKILIRHNHIVINNYELGDCKKLEYDFSIYDRLYHVNQLKILEYIEEEKKLIVPRGVDIHYLRRLFNEEPVVDYNHDPYDRLELIKLRYLPRDDDQKEALAFMCGERKYRSNKRRSQLSVNLNTGKGKTYCSIATSSILSLRSIIITSSIDWLEQWRDCIIEYTDTEHSEIYMLIGSASIHRLLSRDISKYKFILASHDTIKSYGDRNGWDKVTELFKYMKVGIKYYDEAHLNFDNMAKIDAYTNTYKNYYVTATPARSDEDENILYKYYFKNVPSINLFDEDEDPHTDYIAIRYNSRPNPMDISKCKNPYGFDKNKYSVYLTKQDNYYKLLHILINMALKNNKKNVFYIATNKAIRITYKWILDNYPELKEDIGIFTSEIKENKSEQLEKRIILSTTKSLGTAQDIKGLKMVVVLAEPFKSAVLARQTLGRTRDDNTFYIEIVDNGFDPIKRYYREKKPIFNKYAKSVSEIIISDNELEDRVERILKNRYNLINNAYPKNLSISANNVIKPISQYNKPINPISVLK